MTNAEGATHSFSARIDAFLDHIPSSLFRHGAWAVWKSVFGWDALKIALPSRPDLEGLSVLMKRIPGIGTMAYAPGSPSAALMAAFGHNEEAGNRGAVLEGISAAIRPALPDDCAFLRWDLFMQGWSGVMDARLREIRMNASTATRPFRKTPWEYCSLDTIVVDLRGGMETIRKRMDYRTRYALRLAGRRGTEVREAGIEALPAFHALHRKTSAVRGLRTHDERVFRELFSAAIGSSLGLRIYLAENSGGPVAAAVIARQAREAWYLFAASDPERRDACGPTAVLHRAMMDCAEAGDARMDLMGVGPEGDRAHPMAGLSLFKSGFGGERRTRAGAWDYVIEPEAYERFIHSEEIAPV